MSAAVLVRGADVVVGEILVFLGRVHRVTSIEDYRHPLFPAETWRIAREEPTGWEMVLEPWARVEVARS